LRHRDYRLFFFGQLVSLVGTWMQNVGQAWLVYQLTHKASMLGLVSFAGFAPAFFLSFLGGMAADRWDARRIVIFTQAGMLVQAGLLAALTLTGHVRIWEVLVLSAVLGVMTAFDVPARQVLVARTVPREELANAIALNSSIFHGSRVFGPALAGLTVAAFGEGHCFAINAFSYLAALAGLLAMHLRPLSDRPPHPPVLEHLGEGFRYVYRDRTARHLFALLAAICMIGMPYTVLLPVMADQVLHVGARGLGWLMGAGGIGATTAALLLASRRQTAGLQRIMILATLGLGLAMIGFSASRHFALSLLLIGPVGLGMVFHMTSNNTLIQVRVPDALRGRVMALHTTIFMGAMPLGVLVAGHVADRIGAPLTMAGGGFGCFLAALAYAWSERRHLRHGASSDAGSANS
jgi:predicted MFS family arabinose efflux permease